MHIKPSHFLLLDATETFKSYFGPVDGVNYTLDDVVCDGSEESLTDCFFAGPGLHNCRPGEIAGVVCKGNYQSVQK